MAVGSATEHEEETSSSWHSALSIGGQSVLAVVAAVYLIRGTLQPHPERLFAPIGLLFQAVLTVLNPFLGLLTWITVSPFAPFWHLNLSLGAGVPDLGYNRLVFFLLAFILFLQWATGRRPWPRFSWVDGWLLLFLLGYVLSTRLSQRGLVTSIQSFFDLWLLPVSLFFLTRFYVQTRSQLKWALGVLPLIAGYLIVLVLHEQTTGVIWFYPWGRAAQYTEHFHRMTGLLGDPAYPAQVLDIIAPYFLYRYYQAVKPEQKWLYGTGIVLLIASVGMLYNRAGYVGLLLVFIVWAIVEPRFWRPFAFFLSLIGVAALLFSSVLSRSAIFQERLAQGETIGYRGKAFDVGWGYFLSSPIWGIGYNNFGTRAIAEGVWYQYAPKWVPMPHNTYLDILLSAGVIGFAPLLLFMVSFWQKMVTGYRWFCRHLPGDRQLWGIMIASSAAYYVVIATLDAGPDQFGNMVYFYLMGVLWAYLQAATRRRQEIIAWAGEEENANV